ncbi:HNH endonuclease [Streptomyces sp. CoT10]|uniref:HNH endonuclease n=1 Tax=Streptomyces sp. CoT10 TaxID=2875762 RepID=UPI001CD7DD2C|nr:HNH endonuclease [Streptomyces sp. CoT10]
MGGRGLWREAAAHWPGWDEGEWMTNAWLVLAVGEDRTHGSNDGYDDEPSRHYSWDSTVPNHAALTVGDVIALWDKKSLLGVSVIESIDDGQAVKNTYTCPTCGKASFKPRKTKKPVYLCWDCAAEFDVPDTHRRQVTTYRSRHDAAWVDMAGLLPGSVLRELCDAPKSQLSLRPLRWERLRAAIAETGAPTTVTIAETTQQRIAGGHRQATVRVRVGQAAFRKRLLEEHGEVCAFTGPAPAVALEAAHLYSYAETGEHHARGGLLLRRDLHRLFDLGLIAVHPRTAALDVAGELAAYPDYIRLQGRPLAIRPTPDHIAWLARHWNMHRPTQQVAIPGQKVNDQAQLIVV